jgi:hypothetical protein
VAGVAAERTAPPAVADRGVEDGLRLLQADTARARTELYLRLLYGSRICEEVLAFAARHPERVPATTRAVLGTIDPALLRLEHRARRRNLARHLLRAAPSLALAFEEAVLGEMVEAFTDAPEFWDARGRSLAENFCLFAWERTGPAASFGRDVLRLCGIVTGQSVRPEGSPWGAEGREPSPLPGAVALETFVSGWRLVDRAGRLPREDNLEVVSAPVRSRIVVATLADRKVIALSIDLSGDGR